MIQRIQSVYLALAGLLPLLTFVLPFATAATGAGAECSLYSCHAEGLPATFRHYVPWDTIITALLAAALALPAVFAYRKRKLQIRLAKFAVTANVLWFYTATVHAIQFTAQTGARVTPGWGALFPALSIVFAVLAWRAVKRDEALVRAADRIR